MRALRASTPMLFLPPGGRPPWVGVGGRGASPASARIVFGAVAGAAHGRERARAHAVRAPPGSARVGQLPLPSAVVLGWCFCRAWAVLLLRLWMSCAGVVLGLRMASACAWAASGRFFGCAWAMPRLCLGCSGAVLGLCLACACALLPRTWARPGLCLAAWRVPVPRQCLVYAWAVLGLCLECAWPCLGCAWAVPVCAWAVLGLHYSVVYTSANGFQYEGALCIKSCLHHGASAL